MVSYARADDTTVEHGRRHFGTKLVVILLFICCGAGSFGFSNAVIGSTLGQPSFAETMHLNTTEKRAALVSAVLAVFFIGGLFGSTCHALLADRFGRKVSASVAAVIMIVASAICTASPNMGVYIAFRFFCGWASYQLLCTVPTWVTEITPPSHRGVLGNIIALNIGAGYVLAAFIGIGFYFVRGDSQWRGSTGLQMLFPGTLLASMYWLPESPRYLMAKGRHDEAKHLLESLHRASGKHQSEFAEIEFLQIRQQIEWDQAHQMTYLEIFRQPSMRWRALISICLPWCMLGSGVLVINNYGSAIYSKLGYGPLDTLLFLAGWNCVVLLAPFICMTFVDKVSRTYMLAAGFFGCMCTLIVLAALQKNFLNSDNTSALAACVAMTYVYILSYVVFLDGPMFFYIGEIWPSHVRVKGFAIATWSNNLSNIVWTSAAPAAFGSIGWGYYLFFIVQAAIGCIAVLLFFPDTARKPLEEIAALFGDAQDVVVFQKDLEIRHFGKDKVEASHMEKVVEVS